jgi:hypothetical protein
LYSSWSSKSSIFRSKLAANGINFEMVVRDDGDVLAA